MQNIIYIFIYFIFIFLYISYLYFYCISYYSTRILDLKNLKIHQSFNLLLNLISALEKIQLHNDKAFHNLGSQSGDQLTCGAHGASGGQKVVHDQDSDLTLAFDLVKGFRLDFQSGASVFQRIADWVALSGKFAGFANLNL